MAAWIPHRKAYLNAFHQFWDLFATQHPFRTTKSLCFVDAYWARDSNKISSDEYISHLVAHYSGIRHPPNDSRWIDICQSALYERFAASIRKHAIETKYRVVKDTTIYAHLFQSLKQKNITAVRRKLREIERTQPDAIPYTPLATLAAFEGVSPILQLCLLRGATFDRFLARACADGSYKHPQIEKIVAPHESTIRELLVGKMAPDGNWTALQLEE